MHTITDESQKKKYAEWKKSDTKLIHDVWGQFDKV